MSLYIAMQLTTHITQLAGYHLRTKPASDNIVISTLTLNTNHYSITTQHSQRSDHHSKSNVYHIIKLLS